MPTDTAPSPAAWSETFEARVREIGATLLAAAPEAPGWFQRRFGEDALIQTMMGDDAFRVAALRFVDVLPTLTRDIDLARHLEEYFRDVRLPVPAPGLAQWLLRQARRPIGAELVAPLVRAGAHRMARKFIAGDSAANVEPVLGKLWNRNLGFTLDVLGEAIISEKEAEAYQQRYLALIDDMADVIDHWPHHALLETVSGRRSPRLNVSVKVSAMYSQFDAADPEHGADRIKERLRPILRKARQRGAFLTLDMEHYDVKGITRRVFKELLVESEFTDWPDMGIAIQAYLRETPSDLADLIDWAKKRATPVSIRLVRGAYWDFETVIARQHDWPIPVWTEKQDTDACYEHCLAMLFDAYPHVETMVATHNVRSQAVAMALAEQRGIGPDGFELQMLYGMADEVKQRLVDLGQRVRVYVPFGELLPGMAYLVRRLLENSDSQSFGALGMSDDRPLDVVLAAPPPLGDTALPMPPHPEGDFMNEPEHRFTDAPQRDAFARQIQRVGDELGGDWPLVIAGKPRDTRDKLTSVNPANPSQIIGTTASADERDAHAAISAAKAALPEWRNAPVLERTRILRNAASIMRERRDELAAIEVYEAGKPWREADADVCEAIDFLEYYAREAERLDAGHNLDVAGETNRYFYEPRGVGAVIPPWNFPLAIPTGMVAAPIAVGNTVVFKPAPQTPIIAAHLSAILHEAGLPAGVLNYLPGGDDAGKALVAHKDVAFISFTGSQQVGCAINRVAAEMQPGQTHIKHVVAELGGKNAIIVDSDADLDDAVAGVVGSAFGFSGQKCSACSRAIVVAPDRDSYDAFCARLVECAASLVVGDPRDPGTKVGPVIDDDAHARITATIDRAAMSGSTLALHTDCSHLGDGYFIAPTVLTDVDPASDFAQNEIFGPVLGVIRAKSFEDAIDIANGVRFALTGGVYSRSPDHLEIARRRFRVGNLYLNRRCTGAIVNRQPFGGMKLSGTNAKAGGPDYLLEFVEPRTVTENTVRRGFAPETSQG